MSIRRPSSATAPLPSFCGLLHGGEDAPGACSTSLRWRGEDLVGERDLARDGSPTCPRSPAPPARLAAALIAVGVGEIAERSVDRAQAIGAGGHHHAGDGVVPHVAPVGWRGCRRQPCRSARHSPDWRRRCWSCAPWSRRHSRQRRNAAIRCACEAAAISCDVLHAERGLDDQLEADALLAALGGLDLRHQHVDGIDVRRRCRPWGS